MTDTFGEELRRRREHAGLSLAEFADRVHYSKGHLSNVESGRKRPTIELVQRCDTVLEAQGHLIGLFQTETLSTKAGRASKPAQLPATISYFVGRTDAITTLNSALNTTSAGPLRVIAIDGAPGVGKSALAIRWAHDRAERFPDGVLYADLRRDGVSLPNIGPRDALDQFLRAMGVPDHAVPEDFTTRAALYRSMLAGRRMLVVLDNVDSSEQVRPLLPGSTGCVVVATRRTRLSGLVVREGAMRMTVQPLHPDEAWSLLGNLLGNERIAAERDAAALVAERCAYLPLAIRLAAERAAHPAISLAELANDLADHSTRLDVLTVGDDPSSAFRTIVSWSYDALPPASALMFRVISAHPGRDITAPAAAALADTTRESAARTLDHLASVSLVDEHTPGRYRLSPLLQVYAAERLVADDPPVARLHALDRVLTWYLHTATAAARMIGPRQRHLPLARPTWLPTPPLSDRREALSWCDAELQNLVAVIAAATDEGFDPIAWQLPLTLGSYLDLRKPWQTWIDIHHLGLSAARRQENPVAEAWLLTNLAAAYRDRDRLAEAQDLLEESLAVQCETGDQRGEARTLIELGQTLARQSRLDQALGRFRAALQLLPHVGDQHGEATALLGVSEVYCAAGQHAHAQEPVQVALAIFRRLHDRRGEAAALHDLGVTAHGLGYLDEALAEVDQALDAWRDADDLSGRARTLVRRGDMLLDLGKPVAAGASWRDALAIFEQIDDPVASTVRARLHDLGPVTTLADDKAG